MGRVLQPINAPDTRVHQLLSSTLPSIMSSPEPRKPKCGAKKFLHRLFSSSSQKSDVASSKSESPALVPSATVPTFHTRHASAGEFLISSPSVQDIGKYANCKAGLLSKPALSRYRFVDKRQSRSREDRFRKTAPSKGSGCVFDDLPLADANIPLFKGVSSKEMPISPAVGTDAGETT